MLNSFNRTVLIITVILVIIALIITGILILKSLREQKFPPIVGDCPDYWDVKKESSTNNINCVNKTTVNTGKSNIDCNVYPVSNFIGNTPQDVICKKFKWAKRCGIIWDGISNKSYEDACSSDI